MEKTEENREVQRIEYLDVARGIAIILMIIGHIIKNTQFINVIYSFHIPIFVFISGFFFKGKEKINKLFSFYVIVIAISVLTTPATVTIIERLKNILFRVSMSINDTPSGVNTLLSVGAMWFIPFIIVVKLLFMLNVKICKKNDNWLFVLCFIECTIGFILSRNKIWCIWHLDVALYSMLWFYFGYILHKRRLLEKFLNNKLIVFLCFCIWLIGSQFVGISLASRGYMYSIVYVLPVIIATSGIISIIWISKKIEKFSFFLKYCGKNSMYFLVSYYLVAIYVVRTSFSPIIIILLQIIISYLGTVLFDKIIKYFKNFSKSIKKIKIASKNEIQV